MSRTGRFGEWRCTVVVPRDSPPLEYKYLLGPDAATATFELGGNRTAVPADVGVVGMVRHENIAYRYVAEWRGSGVAVRSSRCGLYNGLYIGIADRRAGPQNGPLGESLPTGMRHMPERVSIHLSAHMSVDTSTRRYATQWRGSGVAVPVFALRSAGSLGVGEFNDITLLGDWLGRVPAI